MKAANPSHKPSPCAKRLFRIGQENGPLLMLDAFVLIRDKQAAENSIVACQTNETRFNTHTHTHTLDNTTHLKLFFQSLEHEASKFWSVLPKLEARSFQVLVCFSKT